MPPVLQLRPYQQRWIDDGTRFKGAVKSARIGFSFATAAEAVLDCISHPGTTWTVGSHSKDGSVEFVDAAGKIQEAINAGAEIYNEPYADELGATDIMVTRIQYPNNARIIALPANPRTMRGFPGNVILDEFGHHQESYAIWAAASRQVALGHKVRVLSTPNGEQGKFFDLAHEFGLDLGVAPPQNPVRVGAWSWHWIDVHMAIAEGCPINLEEMRQLYKGDDDTFAQEFLCAFIKAVGSWLSLELIAAAEDDSATMEWLHLTAPKNPLFLGIDVGRDGDRTIAWLDEQLGDIAWTRMVKRIHGVPFFTPEGEQTFNDQARMLLPWVQLATRTAMDSTGIGLGLFEFLASKVPGRVIGVNFSGSVPVGENVPASYASNKGNVKVKTDMAIRLKQRLEMHRDRIPRDPQIRQELMAIKKEYSGGAVRFDAPRIEVDTAVAGGQRKKVYAHADSFWAKALADFAAAGAPAAAFTTVDPEKSYASAERGMRSRVATPFSPRVVDEEHPVMVRPERRSLLWR